jgi:hypothetical protein
MTVSSVGTHLGTLINVPGVNIVHMSIAHLDLGPSITGVTIGIQNFASTDEITPITLTGSATDPTITSANFAISTISARCLRIVAGGAISDTNKIGIRSILIGYA